MIDRNSPKTTCYEVMQFVDEATRQVVGDTPYFVLGGVATSALEHERTKISPDTNEIVACPESAQSIFREEKGKWDRRDLDIMVLDILPSTTQKMLDDNLRSAVEGALIVSSFGLKPHIHDLTHGQRAKMGVKTFLSERTIDDDGQHFYEMFPLVQPVQAAGYQPWRLVTPEGYAINVLHPIGHQLAYQMRSIGGPRPKDVKKMAAVAGIMSNYPQFEALTEPGGVFYEWKLFADAISRARVARLPINRPPIHPSSNLIDQAAFRAKARALHWLEAQKWIVDIALQGPMQKVLNVFTGAGK